MKIVNHEEATDLASIKRESSNLARCYLAIQDELNRLKRVIDCKNDALIEAANLYCGNREFYHKMWKAAKQN